MPSRRQTAESGARPTGSTFPALTTGSCFFSTRCAPLEIAHCVASLVLASTLSFRIGGRRRRRSSAAASQYQRCSQRTDDPPVVARIDKVLDLREHCLSGIVVGHRPSVRVRPLELRVAPSGVALVPAVATDRRLLEVW